MAISTVNSAPQTNTTVIKNATDADKSNKAAPALQANKLAAANAYKQVQQTPTISDAANVQISQKAKEMSLAKKIVAETPDIREDKVAKFKEKIAKGEYKPDAAKITEGIFREAIKDELSKTPEIALE